MVIGSDSCESHYSVIGVVFLSAWHSRTEAGPTFAEELRLLPQEEPIPHRVDDHPRHLPVARAIDARLIVRESRQGKPIHVQHCRVSDGGCRARIATLSRLIAEQQPGRRRPVSHRRHRRARIGAQPAGGKPGRRSRRRAAQSPVPRQKRPLRLQRTVPRQLQPSSRRMSAGGARSRPGSLQVGGRPLRGRRSQGLRRLIAGEFGPLRHAERVCILNPSGTATAPSARQGDRTGLPAIFAD